MATRRRLVIVRLRGGLGNQMFQYAVGRCLSELHGRALFLDDLALEVNPPGTTARTYALGVFPIKARRASELIPEIPRPAPLSAYIIEHRPHFCPEILKDSAFRSIYLQGFWQSEKYFKPIAETIRKEYTFRSVAGCLWKSAIDEAADPVCLHVRRGDYLKGAGKHLGFVGMDYYARAVREIARRVREPHFFVFSDDIAWCERNLRSRRFPHSFVRRTGPANDFAPWDLGLMSMCKHFVIANSSFSWWAAWLGSQPGKVVVAPARWFRDARLDSRDVIPGGWLRV